MKCKMEIFVILDLMFRVSDNSFLLYGYLFNFYFLMFYWVLLRFLICDIIDIVEENKYQQKC